MQDALNNNYQGMTHTGRKPQGLQFAQDIKKTIGNIPGRVSDWAKANPMEAALTAGSMVPGIGDAAGLGADVVHYWNNPKDITPTNLGISAVGAALPFVPGFAGIFAGKKALTANSDALDLAKKMESDGASRDEIWKATGEQFGQPWVNDAKGGGWKFEIDDSGASANDWRPDLHSQSNIPWKKDRGEMASAMPFNDFIEHSKLDKAYWPTDAQAPSVLFDNLDGYRGSYSRRNDMIDIDMGQILKDKGRSTGLHEAQHAIQKREGFSGGGNESQFSPVDSPTHLQNADKSYRLQEIKKSDSYQKELATQNNKWNKEYDPEFDRLDELIENTDNVEDVNALMAKQDELFVNFKKWKKENAPLDMELQSLFDELGPSQITPFEQYKRLAGEAEARNVQTRIDYPMQQRIDEAPWTTLDVPENELIFRGNGNNKSMINALQGKDRNP